mmetsp:Transcript_26612/g.63121  ORF Transcript_26612/g.63121 Transcript_26612/m.63121 type:complete len:211 (-) Transcript_26612:1246-1878(-)
MLVNYFNKVLGVLVDTRRMDVGVPDAFVADVLRLLRNYHPGRKSFQVRHMEQLTGKLIFIAGTASWLKFLLPSLFTSVAAAVGANYEYLAGSNKEFRRMLKLSRDPFADEDNRSFAQGKTAKAAHACRRTHFINTTLREELHLITKVLAASRTGLSLRTPIAHLIRRDPSACAWSDSCLYAAGESPCRYTLHLSPGLTSSALPQGASVST